MGGGRFVDGIWRVCGVLVGGFRFWLVFWVVVGGMSLVAIWVGF